jgi:hypothetical protein
VGDKQTADEQLIKLLRRTTGRIFKWENSIAVVELKLSGTEHG